MPCFRPGETSASLVYRLIIGENLKRNVTFWRENERHLIENYDEAAKDNFKGWVCHHRLELTINGELALKPADLIRHNMYYFRPYFELIYLRRSEHTAMHNKTMRGKFSEERRRNISERTKLAMQRPEVREKFLANHYSWPIGNINGRKRKEA